MCIRDRVNTLNFIWHGFNYPDSLPARQSFLYILLVLLMCYEAFSKLDGFTMRELFVSLACGLGYLLLAGKLVEDDAFTQGTFVLSACLLAAYALLLYACGYVTQFIGNSAVCWAVLPRRSPLCRRWPVLKVFYGFPTTFTA